MTRLAPCEAALPNAAPSLSTASISICVTSQCQFFVHSVVLHSCSSGCFLRSLRTKSLNGASSSKNEPIALVMPVLHCASCPCAALDIPIDGARRLSVCSLSRSHCCCRRIGAARPSGRYRSIQLFRHFFHVLRGVCCFVHSFYVSCTWPPTHFLDSSARSLKSYCAVLFCSPPPLPPSHQPPVLSRLCI